MLSIQIDVSTKCASKCMSCRKKTWPQIDMPLGLLDLIMSDFIFDSNLVHSVCLSGGDPLMYPHIDYLIDLLSKKKIMIGILTAGNFNIDWEKYIRNHQIKWIRFSIDGGDRETYKKLRGVDTFDKVISNVFGAYWLSQKYNRDSDLLRVNFTRSIDNIGHEEKLEEIFKDTSVPMKTWPILHREEMRREYDYKGGELIDKFPCNIVNSHLVIDTDGKVYPCCHLHYELIEFEDKTRDKFCYGQIDRNNSISDIFFKRAKGKREYLCNNAWKLEDCRYCGRYKVENMMYWKLKEDGGHFL